MGDGVERLAEVEVDGVDDPAPFDDLGHLVEIKKQLKCCGTSSHEAVLLGSKQVALSQMLEDHFSDKCLEELAEDASEGHRSVVFSFDFVTRTFLENRTDLCFLPLSWNGARCHRQVEEPAKWVRDLVGKFLEKPGVKAVKPTSLVRRESLEKLVNLLSGETC